MVRKIYLLLMLACIAAVGFAQRVTPEQYIAQYKSLAIQEMKRMGVPAAITLAQGLLETESGNSSLLKKSNNHFGIKCKSSWTGEGVTHDDDAPGECFRSYKDAEASYRDHSNYLRGSDRYAALFKLDIKDYKGWARGLKKAGYATNPKYPDILITNIEQYNLQQYTLAAADEVPNIETDKYKDDPPAKAEEQTDAATPDENIDQRPIESGKLGFINGHKYLMAVKGTSLLVIATENDIDLSRLLSFNDLQSDGILDKDQIIFLQKKSKTGSDNFYTATQQETIRDVAQKNGIQLKYLLSYNHLAEGALIIAGTRLALKPGVANNITAKAEDNTSRKEMDKPLVVKNKVKTYFVQPGEGLYAVARKNKITVQQLREWNNLTSDNLLAGQELIISK